MVLVLIRLLFVYVGSFTLKTFFFLFFFLLFLFPFFSSRMSVYTVI